MEDIQTRLLSTPPHAWPTAICIPLSFDTILRTIKQLDALSAKDIDRIQARWNKIPRWMLSTDTVIFAANTNLKEYGEPQKGDTASEEPIGSPTIHIPDVRTTNIRSLWMMCTSSRTRTQTLVWAL